MKKSGALQPTEDAATIRNSTVDVLQAYFGSKNFVLGGREGKKIVYSYPREASCAVKTPAIANTFEKLLPENCFIILQLQILLRYF